MEPSLMKSPLTPLRNTNRRLAQSAVIRTAVVEVFERRQIAGWVEATPGTGSVPVELCVNDEPVVKTSALPKPGRRVEGQLLQFRFGLTDLWKFTQRRDKVSVKIEGKTVPIVSKGTYYHPRQDGDSSIKVLRKRLANGYVFGQSGRLQLSKALDTEWQESVLGLYERISDVLTSTFELRPFLCYGSLLGAIREGGFIGHDLDFDCAYASKESTGPAAIDELADVSLELIERGFNVVPKRTCLAVTDHISAPLKVDVYHLYRDQSRKLNFPFGIAGDPKLLQDLPTNVQSYKLAGHDVLIPTAAERFIEATYGASWRTPNPGFRWQIDRTASSVDGIVSVEHVDEIARANLSSDEPRPGEVLDSMSAPGDIVVVGASLGHQVAEFARPGTRVVGFERSRITVDRAEKYLKSRQLPVQPDVRVADIYDPSQLGIAIKDTRLVGETENLTFYARAFLGYSDLVLRSLVSGLNDAARSGDHLIADFYSVPANGFPKDKSQPPAPKWNVQTYCEHLTNEAGWIVDSVNWSNQDDKTESAPAIVVAHRP
jgi:hypothetical protein